LEADKDLYGLQLKLMEAQIQLQDENHPMIQLYKVQIAKQEQRLAGAKMCLDYLVDSNQFYKSTLEEDCL